MDKDKIIQRIKNSLKALIPFEDSTKPHRISKRHPLNNIAIASASIRSLAPSNSQHILNLNKVMVDFIVSDHQSAIATSEALGAILEALLFEYENDYLSTVEEIVNAETFGSFIEMAQHLLDMNYKDPAAVIAGSVLEEHLRKMCLKNNIPIDKNEGKNKLTAGELNIELKKKNIYNHVRKSSIEAHLAI
ncbi:MAG: hypothetical protein K2X66_14765, partial [Cyanobacteria bacterium]|nr:hypothetical protein [Cyanobacteriota bacterium]